MMSTLGNLIKIPNLGRHLAAVQLAISENHYTCGKVDAVAKINPPGNQHTWPDGHV